LKTKQRQIGYPDRIENNQRLQADSQLLSIRLQPKKGIEMTQGKGALKEKHLQQFEKAHERLASSAIAAAARGITWREDQ
jgi:hypothetical protein